jgi:hypothetical protein
MPGVSLASLLAAAVVSALVAVGVEWLAKPRLEARKEMILGRYRTRAEVWRALHRILFAATVMKSPRSQPQDAETAGTEVIPALEALDGAFREVMAFTRERDRDLMASYVGMVRGTMESARSRREQGELLATYTPMVMDVLGGPGQGPLYWVRWRYRGRRAREAQALLDA